MRMWDRDALLHRRAALPGCVNTSQSTSQQAMPYEIVEITAVSRGTQSPDQYLCKVQASKSISMAIERDELPDHAVGHPFTSVIAQQISKLIPTIPLKHSSVSQKQKSSRRPVQPRCIPSQESSDILMGSCFSPCGVPLYGTAGSECTLLILSDEYMS